MEIICFRYCDVDKCCMLTDLTYRYMSMSNMVDAIQLTVRMLEGGRGHTLTTHGVFQGSTCTVVICSKP